MKSTDRITTKYDTNMNKKSTLASLATLFMMLMLSASCSNSVSSSGLFGPLCDVYAQIAENNEKVSEAYEAANAAYKTKDKSKAQSLADEANSLAMETNEKNNALWDDAKKIAADKGVNISFVCREIGKSRGYISQMLTTDRDFPD